MARCEAGEDKVKKLKITSVVIKSMINICDLAKILNKREDKADEDDYGYVRLVASIRKMSRVYMSDNPLDLMYQIVVAEIIALVEKKDSAGVVGYLVKSDLVATEEYRMKTYVDIVRYLDDKEYRFADPGEDVLEM
jgi:hypothetical protein